MSVIADGKFYDVRLLQQLANDVNNSLSDAINIINIAVPEPAHAAGISS